MANVNPEDNRLYASPDDLHRLHWERLAARDPEEAARAAGASWDGKRFRLPLLDGFLVIDPKHRSVRFEGEEKRRAGYQHALIGVIYLYTAVEAEPSGRWAAFRELPGGEAFFRGPHSLNTLFLEAAYGTDPDALAAAGETLGGRRVEGGDVAVELTALPRVPLRVLLWKAGEFPASSQLLVDARAHVHLPLDVLWALSNVVIAELVKRAPKQVPQNEQPMPEG